MLHFVSNQAATGLLSIDLFTLISVLRRSAVADGMGFDNSGYKEIGISKSNKISDLNLEKFVNAYWI